MSDRRENGDEREHGDGAAPGDAREETLRRAAVMSAGTLTSRVTGLLRVSVSLAALGVTALSDTYNTANTTPNIVYELILGGILTSVFVPVLVDQAAARGRQGQHEAVDRFLTVTVAILVVVAVAGAIAAPWIMELYLANSPDPVVREQQVELGAFFLRWFMPQIVFYGVTAVATGLLTANRRFAAQMFAPVLNNLVVIATMLGFLLIHEGPPTIEGVSVGERTLLAAGTTLGIVAMTVALWPALRRLGYRWRPRFDWRHESVGRLLRLGRWVAVYVVANQLAYLVIIRFNARIGEGAFTAYSQAFIFFSLPHAIVAVSIFTALLPGLSERWGREDPEGVRELFSRGLRDTIVAMLPAAAGYAVLAGPIVALLAGYGAVDADDADLLAGTLAAFAMGLPFFSAFQLLTRTLYAGNDSRGPAFANVGVGVVNLTVAAALAFALDLGVPGLALGHAASYAFGSAVLLLVLRRRLGHVDGRRIASTVARTALATIATAFAAYGTSVLIDGQLDVSRPGVRLLQVGAAVAVGVLVFGAVAAIVRVREVDDVRRALSSRFRR
jgi:putative peptidoglycan lipid II flippase